MDWNLPSPVSASNESAAAWKSGIRDLCVRRLLPHPEGTADSATDLQLPDIRRECGGFGRVHRSGPPENRVFCPFIPATSRRERLFTSRWPVQACRMRSVQRLAGRGA